MKRLLAVSMLALAVPLPAQEAPVTPGSIVAAAPAKDWFAIAPEDLLVMELAPDAEGNARTVTIQLMPAPFSQGWVGNIRTLAKAHWWDGTNVYRVQDNYVTQWGGGAVEKAEPEGLNVVPESEYMAPFTTGMFTHVFGHGGQSLAETDIVPTVAAPTPPPSFADAYAKASAFVGGFPVALTFSTTQSPPKYTLHQKPEMVWPTHCYGMVGVARGIDNTGSGSDLYVVIGHAPRQLDRNIALVGRVIEGIEHLSSLPRGKGDLGFYEDDEAEKRVPIVSVRLGNELSDPPRFQYLSTESASFARYALVRANRQDDFYKVPAGGVDICNVPVPVRRVAAE